MSKIIEVIDSLNNENVEELKETLKSEAAAKDKANSQLYARAKKAEGFELKDGKWVKKEEKETPEANKKETEKPGEFDYAQKAFLNANGIKGAEEFAKVKEFQADTGKSLDEIVENKYFLQDLKDFRDDKTAKSAMPDGTRGRDGGSAKDNVDYWINKGELPPADQPALRREYVNAKIAKEKGGNPFGK